MMFSECTGNAFFAFKKKLQIADQNIGSMELYQTRLRRLSRQLVQQNERLRLELQQCPNSTKQMA